MARPPLQVEMKFDHLHCHEEGDGFGSSEAYLWTIYFKIDGDSVVLGDDLFLHGNCSLFPTPGSHGNLGDSDIDAGDDVQVPSAIGEFHATLNPIPVPAWVRDVFGVEDVGGVVGVACVLMEENWVSDTGAEAGHVALNNFVRQAIDNLIPTFGISNPEVTPEQISALTEGAADAVSDAISGAQGVWDNIVSWLNGDDLLGTRVFTFTHDALTADAFQDMVHRFQKYVVVMQPGFPNGVPVLVADFELFGKMQGIQTCPVAATTSLLKSQGFMNDKNAQDFAEAANLFRRRVFAGDRGLGAWWSLAERNTASIAGVIRAHPKVVGEAAPAALVELALALGGKGNISEAFVTHATELLTLFATHGSRRLRVDSKAALGVLPSLAGKSFNEAIDILRKQQPIRIPVREQPGS
jgi:hypothetical protein